MLLAMWGNQQTFKASAASSPSAAPQEAGLAEAAEAGSLSGESSVLTVLSEVLADASGGWRQENGAALDATSARLILDRTWTLLRRKGVPLSEQAAEAMSAPIWAHVAKLDARGISMKDFGALLQEHSVGTIDALLRLPSATEAGREVAVPSTDLAATSAGHGVHAAQSPTTEAGWDLEAFIDTRSRRGRREILVKWAGVAEPVWETKDSLVTRFEISEEAIDRFIGLKLSEGKGGLQPSPSKPFSEDLVEKKPKRAALSPEALAAKELQRERRRRERAYRRMQAVARRVRKEEATLAAMRDRGETVRVRVGGGWQDVPREKAANSRAQRGEGEDMRELLAARGDDSDEQVSAAEESSNSSDDERERTHLPARSRDRTPSQSRISSRRSSTDEVLDPMALALSHAVKIAVLKVQERVIDRVTAPTAAARYVIDSIIDSIDLDAISRQNRQRLIRLSSDRWFRLHTPPPLNALLAPNGNGVADLDTFETNAPVGDASDGQYSWDLRVAFEIGEATEARGPFVRAPSKIISDKNGPVHILRVHRHRELIIRIAVQTAGCSVTSCDRVYWGGWSIASEYPGKLESRRQLWNRTMTGRADGYGGPRGRSVSELGILSCVRSKDGSKMTVTVDWPEPDNIVHPLPTQTFPRLPMHDARAQTTQMNGHPCSLYFVNEAR
jgi:hypothetical protein